MGCQSETSTAETPFQMPVEEPRTVQEEAALRERLQKRKEAAIANRDAELAGRPACLENGPLLQNECLTPIPEGMMLTYESTVPAEGYAIRLKIALNGETTYEKRDLNQQVVDYRRFRLSTPDVYRFNESMKKCGLCDLKSSLYKPQYDAGVVTVKLRLSQICGVTLWSNEWQGTGRECLESIQPLLERED